MALPYPLPLLAINSGAFGKQNERQGGRQSCFVPHHAGRDRSAQPSFVPTGSLQQKACTMQIWVRKKRVWEHLLQLLMFCQPRHTQPFNNKAREKLHMNSCFYLKFQGILAMQVLFLRVEKILFFFLFVHEQGWDGTAHTSGVPSPSAQPNVQRKHSAVPRAAHPTPGTTLGPELCTHWEGGFHHSL